jgi:hypothetical protein
MLGLGGKRSDRVEFALTHAAVGALAIGIGVASVRLPRDVVLGPLVERRTGAVSYGRLAPSIG